MLRDPRRVHHMICTAVAPEAVLTVRAYATTAPYEPRFSVQIATQHRTKHEVSEPQSTRIRKRGPSQVAEAEPPEQIETRSFEA